MGCQQSAPVDAKASKSPKAARSASIVAPPKQTGKPRPKGVGGTERLMSNRKRKMAAALGEAAEPEKPKLNVSGQLMPEEVVKRTFCSLTNSHMTLGRPTRGNVIEMDYAYWTQRGYYPDGEFDAVVS